MIIIIFAKSAALYFCTKIHYSLLYYANYYISRSKNYTTWNTGTL